MLLTQNYQDQGWRSIAEQASKETDSKKLIILVAQLCGALDNRRSAIPVGLQHDPNLRKQLRARINAPQKFLPSPASIESIVDGLYQRMHHFHQESTVSSPLVSEHHKQGASKMVFPTRRTAPSSVGGGETYIKGGPSVIIR